MDKEKLELFFTSLDYEYEEVEDGVYLVNADHDDSTLIVISLLDDQLDFRLKLAKVPDDADACFFRLLLEKNIELTYGAVAIDGEELILFNTIMLEGIHADEIHACVMALEEGAQLVYKAVQRA